MSINQRKAGALISYTQIMLGVIISISYTPYMIQRLGQNEYGLYNIAISTISMLSILSLGINSSYIRYYSQYKVNNDALSIKRLNGLFLVVLTIIGLVSLFCGIYLSNNLDIVFKNGLSDKELALARDLMMLLTIGLAISFPMGIFINYISANERFIFLKMVGLMKTSCGPLVTIPLLLAGYRSFAIVLVMLLLSLVADLVYFIYAVSVLEVRFSFLNADKRLFKDILVFTSFIAMNIAIDQINWSVDKLLLARFRGTVAVAVYSVGLTLNSYLAILSTSVVGVYTPAVHRIVNEARGNVKLQKQTLTELFTRIGRIQFLILGLFITCLIFWGKQFIQFWAGYGYEDAYYVALLLALPAMVPLIQNIGIEVQRAMNKHQFRSLVYLAMASLNLGLSIYLCQLLGAIGSAIGTAVSMIIANGIIMNVYYHRKCNIDILYFWKSIIGMLPGIVVPISFGIVAMKWVHILTPFALIHIIIAYTLIYCLSAWAFSMNAYEKQLFLQPLRQLTWRLATLRNRK